MCATQVSHTFYAIYLHLILLLDPVSQHRIRFRDVINWSFYRSFSLPLPHESECKTNSKFMFNYLMCVRHRTGLCLMCLSKCKNSCAIFTYYWNFRNRMQSYVNKKMKKIHHFCRNISTRLHLNIAQKYFIYFTALQQQKQRRRNMLRYNLLSLLFVFSFAHIKKSFLKKMCKKFIKS